MSSSSHPRLFRSAESWEQQAKLGNMPVQTLWKDRALASFLYQCFKRFDPLLPLSGWAVPSGVRDCFFCGQPSAMGAQVMGTKALSCRCQVLRIISWSRSTQMLKTWWKTSCQITEERQTPLQRGDRMWSWARLLQEWLDPEEGNWRWRDRVYLQVGLACRWSWAFDTTFCRETTLILFSMLWYFWKSHCS